jgi:uncharacterized protein (DUF1697 family)
VPVYVSLLRAVNVGSGRAAPMATVREVFESLGHRDVVTYVQSGNVVSTSSARRAATVAADAGAALRDQLGLDTVVIVRTAAELRAVVEGWPFPADPAASRAAHVTFLAERPSVGLPELAAYAPDEALLARREVYLRLPDGMGRTKLNNAFFERRLGVPATTRNWRTVTELVRLSAR